MKIALNKLAEEDLEVQSFVKFKSKQRKLTGKQSVSQLVSRTENYADPDAKFENADLNELSRMGFLDELISGIKTGKEASVFLGRNSTGLVAVKMYTDLRVRSFKRDAAYREGRFIGDARIQKAIEQGSEAGLNAHQILWVQEEFRQMEYLYQHGVNVPKAIAVNSVVNDRAREVPQQRTRGGEVFDPTRGGHDMHPAPRVQLLLPAPQSARRVPLQ